MSTLLSKITKLTFTAFAALSASVCFADIDVAKLPVNTEIQNTDVASYLQAKNGAAFPNVFKVSKVPPLVSSTNENILVHPIKESETMAGHDCKILANKDSATIDDTKSFRMVKASMKVKEVGAEKKLVIKTDFLEQQKIAGVFLDKKNGTGFSYMCTIDWNLLNGYAYESYFMGLEHYLVPQKTFPVSNFNLKGLTTASSH